ncbi:MAG: hypothetical protein H0V96_03375 [Acidimicrobiia bacterium]|nr:hypothetical protein [Acidimicrobiia bacterium]
MTATLAPPDTTPAPVVFAPTVALDGPGAAVVTEALPRAIRSVEPSQWVIVEPVSFPFESMTERQWDAPIAVILPDWFGPEALIAVLGEPLLSRLTPFDVVVSSPGMWAAVRPRFALAETQWRRPHGTTDGTVRSLVKAAQRGDRVADQLGDSEIIDDGPRLVSKWDARTRHAKGRYRADAAVLLPVVAARLAAIPPGSTGAAVEFTDGIHGFITPLARSGAALTVARSDHAVVTQTRLAYPDLVVCGIAAGGSVVLPPEHADVAVGIVEQPYDTTATFLAGVWRALRIGGTLMAVMRGDTGGWTVPDLSALVLDASTGHAILDDVVVVPDPGSGRATSGVFTYSKVGTPATW